MNQEWIRVFGGKIIRCLHLTDLLRKDAKTHARNRDGHGRECGRSELELWQS